MVRHSSDSDSSDYHRKKKTGRSKYRSSSSSSSGSRNSSRKKSKKSKKSKRYSKSPDRSGKHKRSTRDRRDRSSSRHRSKREKRSKRRSRSHSKSSYRSPSYSSRDQKDTQSPLVSKSRRRSRSPSDSYAKKSPLFDGAELLAKLNKAATEALSENSKTLESLFYDNVENRNNIINEINAPNFTQKPFFTIDRKVDSPIITDATSFLSFSNTPLKEEPGSLLHPNLLIEEQNDKLNRWIRKLFLIRQKTLHGEPLILD